MDLRSGSSPVSYTVLHLMATLYLPAGCAEPDSKVTGCSAGDAPLPFQIPCLELLRRRPVGAELENGRASWIGGEWLKGLIEHFIEEAMIAVGNHPIGMGCGLAILLT